MIPHHSGAILMCEHATLTDPELTKLCQTIAAGQQAEINQMNAADGEEPKAGDSDRPE